MVSLFKPMALEFLVLPIQQASHPRLLWSATQPQALKLGCLRIQIMARITLPSKRRMHWLQTLR
jgi:hypothetical protein